MAPSGWTGASPRSSPLAGTLPPPCCWRSTRSGAEFLKVIDQMITLLLISSYHSLIQKQNWDKYRVYRKILKALIYFICLSNRQINNVKAWWRLTFEYCELVDWMRLGGHEELGVHKFQVHNVIGRLKGQHVLELTLKRFLHLLVYLHPIESPLLRRGFVDRDAIARVALFLSVCIWKGRYLVNSVW